MSTSSLSSIIDMTVSVNFEGITDFFPYKFYKNNSIEMIIGYYFVMVLVREASLFTGWGGAAAGPNPYNSRESPYLRKRFFTCPLILPKDSENILGLKFFAPPKDASEIFRPPFATRPKFFAPPFT